MTKPSSSTRWKTSLLTKVTFPPLSYLIFLIIQLTELSPSLPLQPFQNPVHLGHVPDGLPTVTRPDRASLGETVVLWDTANGE
jgi:hypothetical protein